MRFVNVLLKFMANVASPDILYEISGSGEMMTLESINIEVAYATPEKQVIRAVNVDAGTTIGAAIVQSGIMMDFLDLELEEAKVGIFGKIATMTTVLSEGDRVEIYRPLIADPKEVRRKRAAEGKKMKKGG
jgi:putative ubiquitin-RnfH superfamily antitoxin RatB of RatAB toxin-antitoxin module